MLAIQIVNYNTLEFLIPLLDSLEIYKPEIDFEVYILDNNSKDKEMLRDYVFKYSFTVHIFLHDKNIGFGSGQNLLSKQHNHTFLLFLNPDCIIHNNICIDLLISELLVSKLVGATGAKLMTLVDQRQWYDHGDLVLRQSLCDRLGMHTSYDSSISKKVSRVSGGAFCIERRVFENIGRFDENFFMYKEEIDLCFRIRKTGLDIIYVAQANILHIGGVTKSRFKWKCHPYSFLYYWKKYLFRNFM